MMIQQVLGRSLQFSPAFIHILSADQLDFRLSEIEFKE